MRTLLLIAAEPRELGGILQRCRAVAKLRWPVGFARRGEWSEGRVVAVADGPGELAAAAAETAMREERAEMLVSVGVCGALDPSFQTGDVFVPARIVTSSRALACIVTAPQTSAPYHTGTLLSTDRVLGQAAEKRHWRAAGAAAVDMEAAVVAPVAARHGIPFSCIRAVMDRAEESFSLDFDALRDAKGRFSRPRILRAALRRPCRSLPELIRLERQSRRAAGALGEFFAACHF